MPLASRRNSRPQSAHVPAASRNSRPRPHWQTQPTTVAGAPRIRAYAGTSRVTIAPAPTMANSPIVLPARMMAPAPSDAPPLTTVANIQPRLLYLLAACGSLGDRGGQPVLNITFGP